MEKLACEVDTQEKTWVKLTASAHVWDMKSHLAPRGGIPLFIDQMRVTLWANFYGQSAK